MEGNSTGRRSDLDRTDKLPTLSEDKLVKLDRARLSNETDDSAALERSLAQLRNALGEETRRSRQLETRLDTHDQTIAGLQSLIERQAEQTSEVRSTAEAANSQALAARELIGKVQIALRSLHSRVVSLETYIAGRPEGWREMEQALHSKSVRIAEAEAQLAEKIALLAQDLEADDLDTETNSDTPSAAVADLDADRDTDLDANGAANADPTALADADAGTEGQTDADAWPGSDPDADPDADADADPDVTMLEPQRHVTDLAPATDDEPSEPQADSSTDVSPDAPAQRRHSALVGGTPDAPVAHAITKDSVTIGRDPLADITIPAVSVSRYHAIITLEGAETIIEDQSSTNGVFVNDEKIQRKALSSGDEVVIGDSRFRFFGEEARD